MNQVLSGALSFPSAGKAIYALPDDHETKKMDSVANVLNLYLLLML